MNFCAAYIFVFSALKNAGSKIKTLEHIPFVCNLYARKLKFPFMKTEEMDCNYHSTKNYLQENYKFYSASSQMTSNVLTD